MAVISFFGTSRRQSTMANSDATFGVINVDVWIATYPHEKSQIDIENVFDSSNVVFELRIYGYVPFEK